MLDGLADEEVDHFLEEHPTILHLFKIDVITAIESSITEAATGESLIKKTQIRRPSQNYATLGKGSNESYLSPNGSKHSHSRRSTSARTKTQAPSKSPTTYPPSPLDKRSALIQLHTKYHDVFAWSYTDMKGLDPQYYQHQIHLQHDARPVQRRRYRMNPNYAAKVKKEIDKLLHVGFIRPVKRATWLSPIVFIPKKNGQIRVCVDYCKLYAVTITDAFPLPFTDSVLHRVAGHECYSFLDGFNSYNQIQMHLDDQEKTTFVTEWGVFVAEVMMFGLKTAPATFQRIINEIFDKYIPAFMQVFLDDFAVYGQRLEHLTQLRLCLDRCRQAGLSLNPAKCVFLVTTGDLLGHIVNQEGIAMDPGKVQAIMNAPAPSTTKALSRFLGQIRWHSRMLRYLAEFATPLHAAVHRVPFQFSTIKEEA